MRHTRPRAFDSTSGMPTAGAGPCVSGFSCARIDPPGVDRKHISAPGVHSACVPDAGGRTGTAQQTSMAAATSLTTRYGRLHGVQAWTRVRSLA
ncbi:hypothetical protein GCM10027400_00680 [Pseudoxanthomonas daejeonensis]